MDKKTRSIQDEAFKIFTDHRVSKYNVRHVVLLIWKSPIGDYLDQRSGAFEEFCEAEMFAELLKQKYTQMKMDFQIYLDECLWYKNWNIPMDN